YCQYILYGINAFKNSFLYFLYPIAMTLAGKMYFDAVSKMGENAAVSPVSRELGVVLMEISEVHRKVHLELEENFRRFHREIIGELEKKTDMDVKYMTVRFAFLGKIGCMMRLFLLSRQCLETLTHRQMDMQKFIADGCKEALLEEKRRFCFLVDKHCSFSYQIAGFHDKAKDILTEKIPTWQDKCTDITNVPDSVMSMIDGLRTPVSVTPQPSPGTRRNSRTSEIVVPPPAPPLKAQTSPLAGMFPPNNPREETVPDHNSEDSGLARSVSMASGLNNMARRPRVRTIFPHKSGNNNTLLSFEEGDIIALLIPDERDGWLYGELEKTRHVFHIKAVNNNSVGNPPVRSKSVANLAQQDNDEDGMVLPPPDYSDSPIRRNSTKSQTQTYIPSTYETSVRLGTLTTLPKVPIGLI
uniref:BAR/IMD domain containing adaptor protein 2 like 1b n=1 Tax=Astyanax mexicanus TaxID=7994 RepID=A0A8B9HEC9_ASTMX